MIFIVRTAGGQTAGDAPDDPQVRIASRRATPAIVPGGAGQTDLFCVGDDDAPERLRGAGWTVVSLRDGWYQNDGEGGVAVWGQGRYWEVRDTPFTVREAVRPADEPGLSSAAEETVDVRRGIFGV